MLADSSSYWYIFKSIIQIAMIGVIYYLTVKTQQDVRQFSDDMKNLGKKYITNNDNNTDNITKNTDNRTKYDDETSKKTNDMLEWIGTYRGYIGGLLLVLAVLKAQGILGFIFRRYQSMKDCQYGSTLIRSR